MATNYGRAGKPESPDDLISKQSHSDGPCVESFMYNAASAEARRKAIMDAQAEAGPTAPYSWEAMDKIYKSERQFRQWKEEGGMTFKAEDFDRGN